MVVSVFNGYWVKTGLGGTAWFGVIGACVGVVACPLPGVIIIRGDLFIREPQSILILYQRVLKSVSVSSVIFSVNIAS